MAKKISMNVLNELLVIVSVNNEIESVNFIMFKVSTNIK